MKRVVFTSIGMVGLVFLLSYIQRPVIENSGFILGTPGIQSISNLAFGPTGILFIGDSKTATVFAIDTKDIEAKATAAPVEIKNIDQKIAAFLGTETKNITIQDLKVNPVSKKIYCAVQASDGSPVLLQIAADAILPVNLKEIMFSSIALNNVPAEDAKNNWGMSLRLASISDLNFADGKLLVSGLSNQEFGSTFRSIPFPFTNEQSQSSLEIYHAAHGKYETEAPIETFTTADLKGKKFLIASYTCTPLVLFPLDALQPGKNVKGRTIAEFGAGNRPLDMITMKKDDEQFLIIANSDRPVMKVKYKDIQAFEGSLSSPIKEVFGTAGVPYISFPFVGVTQLDKLDETQFVFLQRKANGDLDIRTASNKIL